ncbi:DUF4261 domain-containing protein [Paenibacillus sp. JNUCC31]|uniref:DUF4261 domain-containing protein n=1 Tax=Paenibacillus sp. JNUCC-31 TaxID=2777983 RepID=UPI001786E6C7|nr:DUF4261 domain-containing protein [Paenibacillus sp. JNUCC-31]QOS80373.1 DUF4261 domain-containing protein [Paenibacillus sp. JNUCC-31]
MTQKIENHKGATYSVELLFEEVPLFHIEKIMMDLSQNYKLNNDNDNADVVIFNFSEYQTEIQEGLILNAQCILNTKYINVDQKKITLSSQQTWDFVELNDVVSKVKYSCTLSDVFASGLAYQRRFELFNNVLATILKYSNCVAINWIYSQKISDPKSYIKRFEKGEHLNGGLNVRFFKLDQTNEEMVMDTVGLSCFGLPDLQCRFKNITPSNIAGLLYGYGNYIFENGDIFVDGDSIEGINESQKWICQHEMSLLSPRRVVLNISIEE